MKNHQIYLTLSALSFIGYFLCGENIFNLYVLQKLFIIYAVALLIVGLVDWFNGLQNQKRKPVLLSIHKVGKILPVVLMGFLNLIGYNGSRVRRFYSFEEADAFSYLDYINPMITIVAIVFLLVQLILVYELVLNVARRLKQIT